MDRRTFINVASLTLGGTILQGCCELDESCQDLTIPTPPTPESKTAEVNMASLQQAVQTQRCEMWCWAASISMIFAYHKRIVTQERIVQLTYGSVVCLPSGSSYTIGADLSRSYVDVNGSTFRSQVIAGYDPANNYRTINNAMIVDELRNHGPLLYCNTHHAMVLHSVRYTGSDSAPNIVSATVIDPWPSSPRSHNLTTSELYAADLGGEMTFLAAVRVS